MYQTPIRSPFDFICLCITAKIAGLSSSGVKPRPDHGDNSYSYLALLIRPRAADAPGRGRKPRPELVSAPVVFVLLV